MYGMWDKLYNGVTIPGNPNRHIIFSEEVIDIFKKFQQNNLNDVESGGLLFGKIRGEHFEVTQITTPYRKDKLSRFSFERNDPKHIEVMNCLKKCFQTKNSKKVLDIVVFLVKYMYVWNVHQNGQGIINKSV